MGHSYRDLIVWQKSKALAVQIYRATDQFPKKEVYGLSSQLCRAGVSVASNIAEGQGRLTKGEFQQFLGHSRGSLFEVETQLEIALELDYLGEHEFMELKAQTREVLGLLTGLILSLQKQRRTCV